MSLRPAWPGSDAGRRAAPAVLVLLVMLAAWIRVFGMGDVLTDDPPYHLLRVERLLQAPPAPTAVDPLVAHPEGAVAHTPWGFAWLLAALVRPFLSRPPGQDQLLIACSSFIVLFGVLLVPLACRLTERAARSRGAGLIAAGLLVILPAHISYSIAPAIDHHVLEPLFLGAACLSIAGAGPRARMRPALCGGLLGLSFAFVPAALPPVLLALLSLGAALVARRDLSAAWLGGAAVLATALSLIASPHPAEVVFYSPSLLHLGLVTAVSLSLFLTALLSRRPGRPLRAALLPGAALGLVPLLGAAAALPGPRRALVAGIGYLGDHAIAAMAIESAPLFSDPWFAIQLLTALFPLSILGALVMLLARSAEPIERALGGLTLFLLMLALIRLRFVMVAAPLYVMGVARGLLLVWSRMVRILSSRWMRAQVAHALCAALVVLSCAPSLFYIAELSPFGPRQRAAQVAAAILSRAARADGDGVLAPWEFGHLIQWRARLPTLCDGFFGAPENDAAHRRCLQLTYETDAARAEELLRRYRVRYLVLLPPSVEQVRAEARVLGIDAARFVSPDGRFQEAFNDTLWVRLGRFAARAPEGARGPLGVRLLRKTILYDPATGRPVQQVVVLERIF